MALDDEAWLSRDAISMCNFDRHIELRPTITLRRGSIRWIIIKEL